MGALKSYSSLEIALKLCNLSWLEHDNLEPLKLLKPLLQGLRLESCKLRSVHDLSLCRAGARSVVGERRDGDGGGLGLAGHRHVGQGSRPCDRQTWQVDRLSWTGQLGEIS